jgi:hypothetical protein
MGWYRCLNNCQPKALESKPEGKISIKVNASYNKNVSADYEIDSLLEFMKNEEFRNKILNTKNNKLRRNLKI